MGFELCCVVGHVKHGEHMMAESTQEMSTQSEHERTHLVGELKNAYDQQSFLKVFCLFAM